jgi:hypothetical protein
MSAGDTGPVARQQQTSSSWLDRAGRRGRPTGSSGIVAGHGRLAESSEVRPKIDQFRVAAESDLGPARENRREELLMKLTMTTFLSLDGVMDGPASPPRSRASHLPDQLLVAHAAFLLEAVCTNALAAKPGLTIFGVLADSGGSLRALPGPRIPTVDLLFNGLSH